MPEIIIDPPCWTAHLPTGDIVTALGVVELKKEVEALAVANGWDDVVFRYSAPVDDETDPNPGAFQPHPAN